MSKIMPNYGVLNKIEKPFSSPRVDMENFNSFGSIKSIIKDFYTPNSLSNTGPYKGIVLRIEGEGKPQVGSWLSNYFGKLLGEGKAPNLVRIRVRVPELHSMLPIPKALGDNSKDSAIIDMYPIYEAQSTELPIPELASLVWVDYVNKTNFTDPIYVKPVDNKSGTPGAHDDKSAQNSFDGSCPGNLPSNPPRGDEVSGVNKSLSHSGLPLLPRKSSPMVGKNIVVKGERFNQLIVSSWDKEIKTSGIPGKSWIGCLNSNGANDSTHSLGKRQTIIYSPNVSDFTSPIEIIYYFHGYKEFDSESDFRKRYPENIKKMANDGRNFVLVIPELSWGKSAFSGKAKENSTNKNVWKGFDNFSNFHRDVLARLKEEYSSDLNIGYVSIIAGNLSLKSIEAAYVNGLDTVKPNRIVLTEFEDVTFTNFLKSGIQINLVVKKGSEEEKKYNSFQSVEKAKILYKALDVDVKELWNMVIPYFYDEETKKALQNQNNSQKDPAPKNLDSPSSSKVKSVSSKNNVVLRDAIQFKEARVKLDNFGHLQGTEDVLVKVPSVGSPQFLHILAAKRFFMLSDAWKSDNPSDPSILVAKGWGRHSWTSPADYESYLIQKYGSVEEGRKWKAFNSPHESGLAFDIGNNGLLPDSANVEQQKKTKLYKWMKENAHKFGITPYIQEPWHWECNVPKESWASGEEFTDNLAVRVENPGESNKMPTKGMMNVNCRSTVGSFSGDVGGNIPSADIGKDLKDSKDLSLLWSDFAYGNKPNVAQLVQWAKKVDGKVGDVIRKYQGSIPYGLVCVRMGHETRGNGEKLVTKCCGETGWGQIWHGKRFAQTRDIKDATDLGAKCAEKIPGFDPFNPENNILCSLADWNDRANRVAKSFGKYFPEADSQFWGMVNIHMSIGNVLLLEKANVRPGYALNDLCQWVVDQGANLDKFKKLFGSQSPSVIARRILVTPYWLEAARQLDGKELYSSNFGYTFKQMIG